MTPTEVRIKVDECLEELSCNQQGLEDALTHKAGVLKELVSCQDVISFYTGEIEYWEKVLEELK